MQRRKLQWIWLFLALPFALSAQGYSEYEGGLKVSLNEDGSKYFRLIAWGQFWAQYNENVPEGAAELNFSVRRARVLMYTQLNDKFLLLAHFGSNSNNAGNNTPVGNGPSSQLFFHDFWGEFKITDGHHVGAGLHYWNGISRLNNQSTLNMMTLDNNRSSWATLGLTDQFARHLGVYFKGSIDKFQYRIAFNDANRSSLGTVIDIPGATSYKGREVLGGEASKIYQGYFEYNLLDKESNFLPYKVGTYLGTKRIFNIGAGFFAHPNGSVRFDEAAEVEGQDVLLWAIDAYYEAPIDETGNAVTGYVTYQQNDYGEDFLLGPYSTGSMIYGHAGYYFKNAAFQPYVSYQFRSIDNGDQDYNRLGIGANYFVSGHHAKISAELSTEQFNDDERQDVITVQAMIFL